MVIKVKSADLALHTGLVFSLQHSSHPVHFQSHLKEVIQNRCDTNI